MEFLETIKKERVCNSDSRRLSGLIFGIFGRYKKENVRILNARALTA